MNIVFSFVVKHWKAVGIAALIIALVIQTKRLNLAQERSIDANKEMELKDGEIAKIKIEMGALRFNLGNGNKNGYIPPEAKIDILIKENKDVRDRLNKLNKELAEAKGDPIKLAALQKEHDDLLKKLTVVDVKARTWGTTFKIGYGLLYAGERTEGDKISMRFLPNIDFKLLYWGRYSVTAGLNTRYIGVGITRHADDLVPFFHPQNAELQIVPGIGYAGGINIGLGLRSNF